VPYRTFICFGVAVSPGQLAVIKLPVDEVEKGCALPWAMGDPLVKRLPHGLRAGPTENVLFYMLGMSFLLDMATSDFMTS
jgi:hypothetical protein